jgi:hypothetical protein
VQPGQDSPEAWKIARHHHRARISFNHDGFDCDRARRRARRGKGNRLRIGAEHDRLGHVVAGGNANDAGPRHIKPALRQLALRGPLRRDLSYRRSLRRRWGRRNESRQRSGDRCWRNWRGICCWLGLGLGEGRGALQGNCRGGRGRCARLGAFVRRRDRDDHGQHHAHPESCKHFGAEHRCLRGWRRSPGWLGLWLCCRCHELPPLICRHHHSTNMRRSVIQVTRDQVGAQRAGCLTIASPRGLLAQTKTRE